MKQIMKLLLVLLCFSVSFYCCSESVEVGILHTNDIHGHVRKDKKRNVAGLAAIADYKKEQIRNGRHIILVDSGDAVSGTPLSAKSKGEAIFKIMNEVGYDVMALGNHEFDLGWKKIGDYLKLAEFPLICTNALSPENTPIVTQKAHILERGGIKIGFIGIITPSAIRDIKKQEMKEFSLSIHLKH